MLKLVLCAGPSGFMKAALLQGKRKHQHLQSCQLMVPPLVALRWQHRILGVLGR